MKLKKKKRHLDERNNSRDQQESGSLYYDSHVKEDLEVQSLATGSIDDGDERVYLGPLSPPSVTAESAAAESSATTGTTPHYPILQSPTSATQQDNNHSSAMRRIGTAVGKVASPVVESLDLNAILEQVDMDEIFQKIDVDALCDKIDMNKVLARVDVNRLLLRVDINRHLDRVDLDALIQKSNLEEIISRSTSGVLSGFTNLIRTRMAWVDQWGQRVGRCYWCRNRRILNNKNLHQHMIGEDGHPIQFLPPRPGRPGDSKDVWKNPGELDLRTFGRAIQFRTCGATNRFLSRVFDIFFVWLSFAIVYSVITRLIEYFTDNPDWKDRIPFFQQNWVEFVCIVGFQNLYWILLVGCFGKTLGMWILGLLIVSRDGHRATFLQVVFQALLLPLDILFFGWVVGFMRRDGAFVSDIVGSIRFVYAWDTRYIPALPSSMSDFVDPLTQQEKERLLVDSCERSGSSFKSGDIELSDV